MSHMFYDCKSLSSIDWSGFNTSNVWIMNNMFSCCSSLTSLDLSGFNTMNVRTMEVMFYGCKNLKTIFVDNDWNTNSVTNSSYMFFGCTKLEGCRGTVYDEDYIDVARAHIDGGPSNPGYLSGKDISPGVVKGDVNADGDVNISDVNCIVDVILGDSDTYEGRADVNADGEVNVADINAVIDIIIGGNVLLPPGPEENDYVDLGLPSGTLWATCNVGANSPEDYGDYFAWGETEPKDYYDWSAYKWCDDYNHGAFTLSKYCTTTAYGLVDNKKELDPEDDAATVNMGPEWRTPSVEHLQELSHNCTWRMTTRNGVYGLLGTGPNGNTIFLPAAGNRLEESLVDEGFWGYYWSRTLWDNDLTAYNMFVEYRGMGYGYHIGNRYCGYNVRAVRVSQD